MRFNGFSEGKNFGVAGEICSISLMATGIIQHVSAYAGMQYWLRSVCLRQNSGEHSKNGDGGGVVSVISRLPGALSRPCSSRIYICAAQEKASQALQLRAHSFASPSPFSNSSFRM